MLRIGIDLGGTKIEGIALDGDGRELCRKRVATPRGSYEEILGALVQLIESVESECGARGTLGVGIPGITSPATGLVKNANTTMLIGHPLDKDLESRLGRPVRVGNDANCFALSEATDGAAAPRELGVARPTVFGVILGTGTGGGVVVGGELLVGRDAIAGEWGHNSLPWPLPEECPGPACWCGLSGCIETYLSGPALARAHRERTGQALDATRVAALAEQGDEPALRTLDQYADRLARALASIINVLNPDAIVLGGGVSNVNRLYEVVPQLWTRYVFSDVVTTRLVRAKYGDSSGVRGAAWLWSGS
ncbi:MAG TPA: ROK family protein [Polyangiaceae bacterium]|nr:ROK family protein [Polyangiaceae bacterium]